MVKRDLLERLLSWTLVSDEESCWIWLGHKLPKDYGVISINNSPRLVHRISYKLFIKDPGELCVLHKCDNPPCLNPNHLFLGTRAENNLDMMKKNRVARGEQKTTNKLTDEAVKAIRANVLGIPQRALAKKYKVSDALISEIIAGKRWKHLL